MNFLLHRHFAVGELGSRAAGWGAMLPDLWRMADRRMRVRHASLDGEGSEGDMLRGVRHHLDADAWFHATEVFVAGERATAVALRAADLGIRKIGMFAHVGWEMCLDGALVGRVGAASLLTELGEDRVLHERDAEQIALRCGAEHKLGEAREAFSTRLARIGEQLARGPWIEGYQHGEGLALRLSGVMMRLGLVPPDDGQRAGLAAVMGERAAAAHEALDRLMDARRRHVG